MAITRGNYTNVFTGTTGNSSPSFDSGSGGSGKFLRICIHVQNSNTQPAVTYNSVALSVLASSTLAASYRIWEFGLANPADGSNTVAITNMTGLEYNYGFEILFGASATQPDSFAANTASGTSLTVSVTTIVDNCWLVGSSRNGVTPGTAGANTVNLATAGGNAFSDSGVVQTPAGSHSLAWSIGSSSSWNGLVVAIAPESPTLSNLKTWDGLVKANIKTMDGLAIGSIKSWNGLT